MTHGSDDELPSLRRRQGQQRQARAVIEASKARVRALQDVVNHMLLLKDRLDQELAVLEDDIHQITDSLEVMPDGSKKAQLLRDYNSMIGTHEDKRKERATLQAAHGQASQAYFTASLETSKLAIVEEHLLEEELVTINEQKILSMYKKELEIERIHKVEAEILDRHQEQMDRDRINENNTLRAMEESCRARSLAQERLRVRLEKSKTKAENDQKTKEEDTQKKTRAMLSLKQNYNSALAELKASNERRSKRVEAQNEARIQETATLLWQGINPYEMFRQREMAQKKQIELNRISAMAAKRREDVRKLVAQDVLHDAQKRRREQTRPQQLPCPPTTANSEQGGTNNINISNKNKNNDNNFICSAREFRALQGDGGSLEAAELLGRVSLLPSTKMFSLNLLSVHTDKKLGGELHGLQSALSVASLASSALPSNRSSYNDARDNCETSRSQLVSQRMDGERVRRGGESSVEFKSSRKTRHPKPLSILEQKMMERTMQSLKNNIVKKQVVMNKEFEGKSFITKPSVLLFDDFQVGDSYNKKLTVTNVSLSFNTFKVLELPARVRDFFKVVYAPPGRLSAGTGVTIDVTFTPVLPTPISERLTILAETGQFEVPIDCSPKQCKVSLSTNHVEFDNISLGEMQARTVKVLNNGGLESNLDLSFDDESCSIDSASATHVGLGDNNKSVAATVKSAFAFRAVPILKPYSTQSLDISFTPTVLGSYYASILCRYKGADNNPTVTRLSLTGTVSDVPIYLSAREIDFHVCFCGQLYRESLVLHNRGKIALKATAKVPTLLKRFVEFVPRVAFVQAHSSLSVQLKFKPTAELLDRSLAGLMSSANPTPTLDLVSVEHEQDCSQSVTTSETLDVLAIGTDHAIPSSTSLLHSCIISTAVTVNVLASHQSDSGPSNHRTHLHPLVWFQLNAIVTNPILTVAPNSLEFGECSITVSVSVSFCVSNQSIAAISYGFVHLPKEVQISPGDGFGTLLPLEERNMVATFSPVTAVQHNFALTLKTDQGSVVTIPCSGTGVKPTLLFSPAIIAIPPTSLGDVNTTSVFLENVSKVPQIFEICVPEDCPFLQITPVVQTINPASRAHIKIDFEPGVFKTSAKERVTSNSSLVVGNVLDSLKPSGDQTNRSFKPRHYSRRSSNRALATPSSSPSSPSSPSSSSSSSSPSSPSSSSHHQHGASSERKSRKKKTASGSSSGANLETDNWRPSSKPDDLPHAQQTFPQPLEGRTFTWKIPCFSKPASATATAKAAPSLKEAQQTFDTAYLEISAIVAPPTLVRVPELENDNDNDNDNDNNNDDDDGDDGRSSSSLFASSVASNAPVNFGQVPIGQSVVRKITIKNNSLHEIKPQLAAVYGNVTVLNAIRPMLPKQSQVLQIQYKPDSHGTHLESIEMTVGQHHRLIVPVQGQGVSPKLFIDPYDHQFPYRPLDLGFTIAKDSSKKEIKLINASQFAVGYRIHLLRTGPKNMSGINPFSVVPSEGEVPVATEKIITVTFEPDHENYSFHDELQIQVKSESSKRTIYLKGACTGTRGLYMMTTTGLGDPLALASTSSAHLREMNTELIDIIKPGCMGCVPRGSFTLSFTAAASSPSASLNAPIVRSLLFGNAKVKREKGLTGEVIFEPLSTQGTKDGFSMDGGPRFLIEVDSIRSIQFTFDPHRTPTPNPTPTSSFKSTNKESNAYNTVEGVLQGSVETSVKCTLRGGYSAQDKEGISFTLILVGHYFGKIG